MSAGDDLTPAEIEQLAGEAPVPLSASQRAARARGIERSRIRAAGGGISAARLPRCPHGRLRAVCHLCEQEPEAA